MLKWMKDGLASRQRRHVAQRWRDVGRAFEALLADERALHQVPPEAAWHVVHGVHAALRGVEQALRTARRHGGPPEATRALAEAAYAVAELVDAVEKYGLPGAEGVYGPPPRGTRWKMSLQDGDRTDGEGTPCSFNTPNV